MKRGLKVLRAPHHGISNAGPHLVPVLQFKERRPICTSNMEYCIVHALEKEELAPPEGSNRFYRTWKLEQLGQMKR